MIEKRREKASIQKTAPELDPDEGNDAVQDSSVAARRTPSPSPISRSYAMGKWRLCPAQPPLPGLIITPGQPSPGMLLRNCRDEAQRRRCPGSKLQETSSANCALMGAESA